MRYIEDAISSNKPIWVKNNYKPRGIIIMAMYDSSGRQHKVVIPNTPYPICLSNMVTRDMIDKSFELRTYINKNVLVLVDHEEAEKEWNKPYVREAVAKATKEATGRGGQADISSDGTRAKVHKEEHSGFVDVEVGETESGSKLLKEVAADTRVIVAIEQLKNKEIKPREATDIFDGIELTKDDLKYIVRNSAGIVEKWAKTRLSEMLSSDEEEEEIES